MRQVNGKRAPCAAARKPQVKCLALEAARGTCQHIRIKIIQRALLQRASTKYLRARTIIYYLEVLLDFQLDKTACYEKMCKNWQPAGKCRIGSCMGEPKPTWPSAEAITYNWDTTFSSSHVLWKKAEKAAQKKLLVRVWYR